MPEKIVEIGEPKRTEVERAVHRYWRKRGFVGSEDWISLGNFLDKQGFSREEIALGARIYSNRTIWSFADL